MGATHFADASAAEAPPERGPGRDNHDTQIACLANVSELNVCTSIDKPSDRGPIREDRARPMP